MNINELGNSELQDLHYKVVEMRKQVLELVQLYGYDVSGLVTKRFEHDIEQLYGNRALSFKPTEETDNERKNGI